MKILNFATATVLTAAIFTASSFGAGAAYAAPAASVDQQHFIPEGTGSGTGSQTRQPFMLQTFTAGVTGELVSMELKLKRQSAIDENVLVEVYQTDNTGVPTQLDSPLAEAVVPGGLILTDYSRVSFTFVAPLNLVAGHTYAFSVMNENNLDAAHTLWWLQVNEPDDFAGQGCTYVISTPITSPTVFCGPGWNYDFATYMIPTAVNPDSSAPNEVDDPSLAMTGFNLYSAGFAGLAALLIGASILALRRRVER